MKKYLITGSNGLLARSLIRRLSLDHEIYATCHSEPVEALPKVRYLTLDAISELPWEGLPSKIDVVIHLAQSSKYRDFPEHALDIFSVNSAATARLIDYSYKAGASQFVYFSTGGLYQSGDSVVHECSPLLPIDGLNYHFASKLCGEIVVNTYSKLMNTVIVRPFFIYGKGQRGSMLIPSLVHKVRESLQIFLEGENGIRINPVNVEDAALFVARLVESGAGGVFNMAGPEVLSIKDICETIGRQLGIDPIYNRRDGEVMSLVSSIAKMEQIGAGPKITFAKGIEGVIRG